MQFLPHFPHIHILQNPDQKHYDHDQDEQKTSQENWEGLYLTPLPKIDISVDCIHTDVLLDGEVAYFLGMDSILLKISLVALCVGLKHKRMLA